MVLQQYQSIVNFFNLKFQLSIYNLHQPISILGFFIVAKISFNFLYNKKITYFNTSYPYCNFLQFFDNKVSIHLCIFSKDIFGKIFHFCIFLCNFCLLVNFDHYFQINFFYLNCKLSINKFLLITWDFVK